MSLISQDQLEAFGDQMSHVHLYIPQCSILKKIHFKSPAYE